MAGLKPSVSKPSKASVWLRELSAVMALAGCWPVVSGALKAALLIVVIACSVSEPAGPTIPRIGDGAGGMLLSVANSVWPTATACVALALRIEEPPFSV